MGYLYDGLSHWALQSGSFVLVVYIWDTNVVVIVMGCGDGMMDRFKELDL